MMQALRRLALGLMAALALANCQAVPVLHGLAHLHHYSAALHVHALEGQSHNVPCVEQQDGGDHEVLHFSACASLSTGKAFLPVVALVSVLVGDVATEPGDPSRDVTRPLLKSYVAAPPDQPRAPPVG